MTAVREERPEDAAAIRVVNERAFGGTMEADLVDTLRAACPERLSLVAADGEDIIGHILFTPATITTAGRTVTGMGLAPMAVLPERQRQGIGSRLAQRGLGMLKERNCPFVIVLGHAEYYPRFGFAPASRHGIACQWPGVPDDVFMILILDAQAMAGVTGIARYRPEFDEAMKGPDDEKE